MENTNRMAVESMDFMPVPIKPPISSALNPAMTAAISGRQMNATGGLTQLLMSTTIRTAINTKPMTDNMITSFPD